MIRNFLLLIISIVAYTSTFSGCSDTSGSMTTDSTGVVVSEEKQEVQPETQSTQSDDINTVTEENQAKGTVVKLTTESFKEQVFDYTKEKQWNYRGNLPAVIDFYADWCGPCKRVAPIMEELAKKYEGKVIFYKLNVDEEREIAGIFGIQNIPSILFIPVDGQPQMGVGAYPKQHYIELIEDIFKVK